MAFPWRKVLVLMHPCKSHVFITVIYNRISLEIPVYFMPLKMNRFCNLVSHIYNQKTHR